MIRQITVKLFLIAFAVLTVMAAGPSWAQSGFPDSLRRYSDSHKLPFRIGTAVTLHGGPSLYPSNGYQPGILTDSPRDRACQEIVRGQFNQIEPGNELKMGSLWTGGAARVGGRCQARTNLFDVSGPLAQSCAWAESQKRPLTVRGHCMVYNPQYTLPIFPAGQPPLFVRDDAGTMTLGSAYTRADVRDLLESYVRQVVDATMIQNAMSRTRHGYRVVEMWDVTNEVVSDDPGAPEFPGAGFAYRRDDPWYDNGPRSAEGFGYDYAADIYRWAAQEMRANIGKALAGHRIEAADTFTFYYNDYNLEWSSEKLQRVLNLIRHVRSGGGVVDGLGFQAHVDAKEPVSPQFEASITAAIAAGLRFAVTELDCAIEESPKAGQASVAEQEKTQGRNMGAVARLCVQYRASCDCFQLWGITDDGSWLANKEATPITRWTPDTRSGPTEGQEGYWPKQGQFSPQTLFDVKAGAPDPHSGHVVSDAYDQILAAFKSAPH